MVDEELAKATPERLRYALDGTIADTQAFCWAALRQFRRREAPGRLTTPEDFGLRHAEYHMLLVLAFEAVSHVHQLEKVLGALGVPHDLPPDKDQRKRLREARNLLAEHRDERVLFWRLTGENTPHVVAVYTALGLEVPHGIDSEMVGYVPDPNRSDAENAIGLANVGTVGGGLLSLPRLRDALEQLSHDLAELATLHCGGTSADC